MAKRKKASDDRYLALVDRVIALAEKVINEHAKERKAFIEALSGIRPGEKPSHEERVVPSDEELWRKEMIAKGFDPEKIAEAIDNDTTWDAREGLPQQRREVLNGNDE